MTRAMLAETSHRPWPLPRRSWILVQVWHDLLFAHWPIAASELYPLIPPGLALDTYEGQAWISVAPFEITGVRLRGFFPLPLLSSSLELNVRTYVMAGNRPGVFFFSLDATNPAAVILGRHGYHLPYFRATMSLRRANGMIHYRSRRRDSKAPAAEFSAQYRPAGDVFRSMPGSLDHWLTERYCLYAVGPRGRLLRAEIHHAQWPLQPACADIEVNTMAAAAGISVLPGQPLLHFARKLEVLAWGPERTGPPEGHPRY